MGLQKCSVRGAGCVLLVLAVFGGQVSHRGVEDAAGDGPAVAVLDLRLDLGCGGVEGRAGMERRSSQSVVARMSA